MNPEEVKIAQKRIERYIVKTPILKSEVLNELLQSDLYFKFEGAQRVGNVKTRGALNGILALMEQTRNIKKIVAYSSGNHAQAVAWCAKVLGLKATIFMPSFVSKVKIAMTRIYGAELILTEEREEAEELAKALAREKGCFLISPYDNDDVVAGQGTAVYEAWVERINYDGVFMACGGGGLVSGSYLATQLFSKTAKVFAAEPLIANDAAQSYKSGIIYRFKETPKTISDGARTLGITERTFSYIKKLNGIYEISEEEIIYWTQWMMNLLKVVVEPTSALGMAAAYKWIQEGNVEKKILVIISGSNIDQATYKKIWEKDYLSEIPSFKPRELALS